MIIIIISLPNGKRALHLNVQLLTHIFIIIIFLQNILPFPKETFPASGEDASSKLVRLCYARLLLRILDAKF